MVYYAGKLFGVINVNERAKNRDEVGVEGHKEAWQAKIFYTCRAYHSILDDSNTMGSNLRRFLTIARRWNLPVNCPVIHCMCNIIRQKTTN